MPGREKHIAVLVDTSTGWGRRLIRGVLLYAQKHGPWHVMVDARGQEEHLRLPAGWNGDGILARISTERMARELAVRKPVVNVSVIKPPSASDIPQVTNDIGVGVQLAMEHFFDRGLRNFAYCSLEHRSFIRSQKHAFTEQLAEHGLDCHVYAPEKGCGPRASWQAQAASLERWLVGLPKPVGILTWAVRSGVHVINACGDAGVRVPDDVCVIGGDEDDLLCEACRPSLSAIAVPAEQIGHDAAQLLDKLMAGAAGPKKPRLIEPSGIVARLSTEALAVSDPDLIAAIRFIRETRGRPLQVEEVVEAANISRRSLERRFGDLLGRTIQEEIARVRMERATMLLAQTEMPIPAVADAAGFGSPEYFATTFKKARGTTPLKYRTQIRGR